jgi:hypothetical protein
MDINDFARIAKPMGQMLYIVIPSQNNAKMARKLFVTGGRDTERITISSVKRR